MPASRWVAYRVSMTAVIGDVAVPVTSASINFTLNGIPDCSLRLPVGREVSSLEASLVHANVSSWRNQLPVFVYATITPLSDSGLVPDLGIPADTFLLFEGVLSGVGYIKRKDAQGVTQLAIKCRHWLSKLDHGSIFSETSHPNNPSQYSYGALHPLATPGGDTARGSWSAATVASRLVTAGSVQLDFWGEALYKWFDWMADQNAIWIREVNLQGSGKNYEHKFALDRMAPDTSDEAYIPLSVKLDVSDDLASLIATDISLKTADATRLAQQTIWDLLVGRLASDYLFAVVPTVDRAYVVPYVPTYRTAWRTLYVDTTTSLTWTSDNERQLRAIGVLASHRAVAGGVVTADGTPSFGSGVGGWFEGEQTGMVMLIPAPRWASNLIADPLHRPKTTSKIPTDTEPDADNSQPPPDADAQYNAIRPFLNSYARYYYSVASLAGRQGTLSGPLRFDIAPGSALRIEGLGEPFVSQQVTDELEAPLYGTVMRVSISLDSESGEASSAFHLAYMRTEAENTEDKYSLTEHPLYATVFSGARLVKT